MSPRRLAPWLWLGAIWFACLLPAEWLPFHERGVGARTGPHLDKMVHFVLFLVFGVLWGRSRPLVGLGIAVATAVVTELAQSLEVVGRDADLWDGLSDVAGALVGLAFAWMGTTGGDPAGEPEGEVATEETVSAGLDEAR